MKVSVIGLGYVGCVSAACLAQTGHEVIGVDVSQLKVSMVNDGHSPIIEPGINELLVDAKDKKRLSATTAHEYACQWRCLAFPANDRQAMACTPNFPPELAALH